MKKSRWSACVVTFGMALAFSLAMLTANSPLFRAYGSDSAIFVTIGRAIAGGAVPYADIFDHKGPVIFYINALAQAVWPGTTSIWVMELLFLFASLRVIRRIADRLAVRGAWVVQLAYLALMGLWLDGGNYTEEYCNLFTLLALEWGLAFAQDPARPWRYPLGIGAMAGLCAMVRLNNALPIAGLVLALSAWLLLREPKAFWRGAAACAAGAALAVLPFVFYFAAKGALGDFYYGAFVHNVLYTQAPFFGRVELLLSKRGAFVALCALCAAAALLCRKDVRAYWWGILCAALLGGAGTLLSPKGYGHYLLICIPAALLGVAGVLGAARDARRERTMRAAVCAAACAALLWGGAAQIGSARALLAEYPRYTEECRELAAHIPFAERGDALGYRVEPKWYVASGITPARRIFFMQEILAQVDPALMRELLAMFEQHPPRWLALPINKDMTTPIDPRVMALIDAKYEKIAENDYNEIRRLKD